MFPQSLKLVWINNHFAYFLVYVQKQRTQLEKDLTRKEIEMQDLKNSVASETKASPTSSVNELHLDIMVSDIGWNRLIVNISHSVILDCTLFISQKFQEEIEEKESLLEKLQDSLKEAELKANELKASYEKLYGMLAIHLFFLDLCKKRERLVILIYRPICFNIVQTSYIHLI